ncbi:MAG: response regulator transcription factor [Prevotella sp.]|nr:response regulator transcription factor [Prevotella sp.]
MTCMIIDDEPLAVKLLESFVARTPQLQLVGSFTDSVEAIAALRQQHVDLVFLDIQMPDLDGMELAHMLPAKTMIIFTTAFKEYAFDSYEVSAVDFLLKPIRYNKFLAAVEKCKKRREPPLQAPKGLSTLFIRVDGELRQLQQDDILYVEGMKDYVMFYLQSQQRPLITHLTMKAVEDMLPADRFMRVHRSFIVALDKIRSIDRNDCIYIGQQIIHVTEAYREAFQQYVTQRISSSSATS